MMNIRLVLLLALLVGSLGCGDAEPVEQEPETDETLPETKEEAALLTNEGKGDFSLDICKKFKWYDDGSCDWFCPARDVDCNGDPIGPEPNGTATKFPIVLAHGFMGSRTNFWSFHNLEDALIADGHVVFPAEVPPFHGPSVRAQHLAEQIDTVLLETDAEKVNIIAHSMGGIDARFLVSELGYGDRVASVTTISSPHRGTKVADIGLKILPGKADKAIDALLEMIGKQFSDEAEEASFRSALESLSVESMEQFNLDHPNDDRVFYQSWAGVSAITGFENGRAKEACGGDRTYLVNDGTYDHMDGLLWLVAPFVAGAVRPDPNDGMATVASAKWGEFQGCIPADHLDEVGQIQDESDLDTGFDHIRFYRNVSFELTRRGF